MPHFNPRLPVMSETILGLSYNRRLFKKGLTLNVLCFRTKYGEVRYASSRKEGSPYKMRKPGAALRYMVRVKPKV